MHQDELLDEIRTRGQHITALEEQIADEIEDLKPLMRQADLQGVTKYRLAQLTGMTQPRVARLVKRS